MNTKMTDRELLESAAKVAYEDLISCCDAERFLDGLLSGWNPLQNDSDALRLAIKLQLNIHLGSEAVSVSNICYKEILSFVWYEGDSQKATRRAIVMAAAKIWDVSNELS